MNENKYKDALFWMCYQYCNVDGVAYNSFMVAGENAFYILGIQNGNNYDELIKRFRSEGWLEEYTYGGIV